MIKKELTLIKTQIDGLLDSLDRMDTKAGNDHRGESTPHAGRLARVNISLFMRIRSIVKASGEITVYFLFVWVAVCGEHAEQT